MKKNLLIYFVLVIAVVAVFYVWHSKKNDIYQISSVGSYVTGFAQIRGDFV